LTIRQLGYPTKNALRAWYREYERHCDLPAGYVRQLTRFIEFYNTRRPHSALDKKTPEEFYFATLPAIQQAA